MTRLRSKSGIIRAALGRAGVAVGGAQDAPCQRNPILHGRRTLARRGTRWPGASTLKQQVTISHLHTCRRRQNARGESRAGGGGVTPTCACAVRVGASVTRGTAVLWPAVNHPTCSHTWRTSDQHRRVVSNTKRVLAAPSWCPLLVARCSGYGQGNRCCFHPPAPWVGVRCARGGCGGGYRCCGGAAGGCWGVGALEVGLQGGAGRMGCCRGVRAAGDGGCQCGQQGGTIGAPGAATPAEICVAIRALRAAVPVPTATPCTGGLQVTPSPCDQEGRYAWSGCECGSVATRRAVGLSRDEEDGVGAAFTSEPYHVV